MAVAGASRYLTSATLANQSGFAGTQTGLIENLGTVDLLDVARSASGDNGIGLSSNARALNKSFLSSTADTFNAIFSLGVAQTSSVEALQQQILAMRSSLSPNQVARDLVEDDGSIQSSFDRGTEVDEEA